MGNDNTVRINIEAYNKTQAAFAELKNSFMSLSNSAGGSIEGILGNITKINPALLGISATVGAVTSAIGLAYTSLKKWMEVGEQLNAMSQKTGISVEDLSLLRYAVTQSETDMETLEKSVGKFSQKIAAAMANSGSDEAKAFKKLGISVKDSEGNLKSTFNLLLEVADAMENLSDGAVKVDLVKSLFGKGGTALIPLLNEGSEGIRNLMKRAEELGLSFTTEGAKAADEMSDSIKDLGYAVEGLKLSIGALVAGPLQDLIDRFSKSDASKLRNEIRKINEMLDDQGELAAKRMSWQMSGMAGFIPTNLVFNDPSAAYSDQARQTLKQRKEEYQKLLDADKAEKKQKEQQRADLAKQQAQDQTDKKALDDKKATNDQMLQLQQQYLKESLDLYNAEVKARESALGVMRDLGLKTEEQYYSEKQALEVEALQTSIDTLEKEIAARQAAWDKIKDAYKEDSEKQKAAFEVEKDIAQKRAEINKKQIELEAKATDEIKGYMEAAKKTAEGIKNSYGEQEKAATEWQKVFTDAYDNAIKKVDELKDKQQQLTEGIQSAEKFLSTWGKKAVTAEEQKAIDYKALQGRLTQENFNYTDQAQTLGLMKDIQAFMTQYKGTKGFFEFGSSSEGWEAERMKTALEDLTKKARGMQDQTAQDLDIWQRFANDMQSSAQAMGEKVEWLKTKIEELNKAVNFDRQVYIDTSAAESQLNNLLIQIANVKAQLAALGGSSSGQVTVTTQAAEVAAPSLAVGTPYVYKGGLVNVHAGEAVLTKEQNSTGAAGSQFVVQGGIIVQGANKDGATLAREIDGELARLYKNNRSALGQEMRRR
jgi:hypothetical protein